MAEIGIICNIDGAAAWDVDATITFENENVLLSKVMHGVQGSDYADVICNNIVHE